MYEVLSEFYDLFMDKGDWTEYALEAVKGLSRGADVGCGSGEATLRLCEGHDVVAIDCSEQMLAEASKKFHRLGLTIPVIKQSADKLSLCFKADFITAVCDVVNYLRFPEKFFKAAHDNLRLGGVLAFDMSSEYKLRNIIGNNVFTETKNDVTYVWENSLKKKSVDMTITFFAPDGKGSYKKFIDCQRQYIFAHDEIKDMLTRCGFEVRSEKKKDRSYFTAKRVE